MKQRFYLFTGALYLCFLFAGCEAEEESINPVEADSITGTKEILQTNKSQEASLAEYFVKKFTLDTINTYEVKYDGRYVKGTGLDATTTFKYLVTGKGETPQLDSFTLDLPGCAGALSSWSPQKATNVYGDAIKWNNSVSKDGSQQYSITFKGDIPLGVINATITRGSISETKSILGPCKGLFTLSGSIYIDANEDGIKQASESGIPSFNIDLYDLNNTSSNPIGTASTSANGSYSFTVLAGSYKIAVSGDLLNDSNYTSTGETIIDIPNVTANSIDNNFGYLINSEKIIRELEDKIIPVNTEPTKFWVQQIRNAGKKSGSYSKEDIRGFLVEIESLLLADTFQFGADKEAAALNILSRPIRTDFDEFLQQLLTAELNVVSKRGALLNPTTLNTSFNSALLIYSEAVACREIGNCPGERKASSTTMSAEVKAIRSSDTRILLSFNGSGGV